MITNVSYVDKTLLYSVLPFSNNTNTSLSTCVCLALSTKVPKTIIITITGKMQIQLQHDHCKDSIAPLWISEKRINKHRIVRNLNNMIKS